MLELNELVEFARGAHYLSVEMMYCPRPQQPPAQLVFDTCLLSRIGALDAHDVLLLLVDSEATEHSLDPVLEAAETRFGARRVAIARVNPLRLETFDRSLPAHWEWDEPSRWRQMQTSDRWARIDFALHLAAQLAQEQAGFLLMPAQDAVYGRALLERLESAARYYACEGVPAAISPFTPYQHHVLPGVDIPRRIIDAMNAAFSRTPGMRQMIESGQAQSFWGKMNLTPFALCRPLLQRVSRTIWEDDKEIDRALAEGGFCARALWIDDPALYQQTPPVFDRADLKRVIERTLHYSLNIAAPPNEASALSFPQPVRSRLVSLVSPASRSANRLADALIAECRAEISQRLARFGVSWVDWGAYRYVVRVGDPDVQVWGKMPG
jgi:hypothetical protein